MEIKIFEQKDNPILNRTRIKFEITQEGNPVPSRLKVIEQLASKLKKDKNLIVIREINPDFGSSNVEGEAILYSSKKALEKLEPKYTLKRLEAKEKKVEEKPPAPAEKPEEAKPEEQAAEEAPAEEKPAEASETPSEEPKEEPKETEEKSE
ncbi:MAG: hypothetical protein JSW73_02855 [Candidatus Woesearchaeota archaeon]|nr:MAG: hypothetical protein JSW73_02855 [Candidatus Woesearchaeota archaeon]